MGVSKMQVLGLLVAILIVSCGATDAKVEEEERAIVQGFHCDYLILSDVPSLSGCNNGFKFVIRKSRGVRSQYLILGGKTVLAFLNLGQKFSRCRSFNNITPRVTCKGPVGDLSPNFTPGNWTAGGAGRCPEFCIEIYRWLLVLPLPPSHKPMRANVQNVPLNSPSLVLPAPYLKVLNVPMERSAAVENATPA